MIKILLLISLFLTSSSIIHADVMSGLVGWWKLDEGSGISAFDSSGNGNTGTLTNGPTWVVHKRGSAVSFDGAASHYITAADSASLDLADNVSVAVWVYPTTSGGGNKIILSKHEMPSNSANYELYLKNLTVYWWDGSAERNSATDIAVNTWTHLAATLNGTALIWYVNGESVNSMTVSDLGVNNGTFLIGRDQNTQYFSGRIDDVRIYNRVLTDTEIKAIYLTGVNRQVIKGRAQLKNIRMK